MLTAFTLWPASNDLSPSYLLLLARTLEKQKMEIPSTAANSASSANSPQATTWKSGDSSGHSSGASRIRGGLRSAEGVWNDLIAEGARLLKVNQAPGAVMEVGMHTASTYSMRTKLIKDISGLSLVLYFVSV
jgi:hypothetical protein